MSKLRRPRLASPRLTGYRDDLDEINSSRGERTVSTVPGWTTVTPVALGGRTSSNTVPDTPKYLVTQRKKELSSNGRTSTRRITLPPLFLLFPSSSLSPLRLNIGEQREQELLDLLIISCTSVVESNLHKTASEGCCCASCSRDFWRNSRVNFSSPIFILLLIFQFMATCAVYWKNPTLLDI